MRTPWPCPSAPPPSVRLPRVYGLVAVHAVDVAPEHPPQCALTGVAGLLAPAHLGSLPCGPVGRTKTPSLDDVQQPAALVVGHAPQPQPLGRAGQQLAHHELRGPELTNLRPVEVGVDAVPGPGHEVLVRGLERHLAPDRAVV